MKALILKEYMKFAYDDVPMPQIGAEDALIAVKACGICGSDVHGMDGSTGRRRPPIIMGHEAAGVIVETGARVTDWKKGDRVTFDSTVYCGECWFCRKGLINLCDHRRVLGVSCEDYHRNGAFAEFVAVPQRILYRLSETTTFEQAALIEALSVAVHAAGRAPLAPDAAVAVVGAGMIGLLILQTVRAKGCRRLIAIDIDGGRLELARRLGADVILRAGACDVPQAIRDLTEGRGADVAFEAVGVTDSVQTAILSLRKGGALVVVGNLAPTVELPAQAVVTRQLSLLGSYASAGEYPRCLEMIARGAISIDALISATAPLSDGAAWFQRLYDKESGLMKVILQP